jgi:hypothetical protein
VARSDGVVQRWDRRKTKAENRNNFSFLLSAFQFPVTLNYPVGLRRHLFTEGECASAGGRGGGGAGVSAATADSEEPYFQVIVLSSVFCFLVCWSLMVWVTRSRAN